MANEKHLKILKQGVEVWNKWREKNPKVKPTLDYAELRGANLSCANLQKAHLMSTNFNAADLSYANLSEANLDGADLTGTNIDGADFSKAELRGCMLPESQRATIDGRTASKPYDSLEIQSREPVPEELFSKKEITGILTNGLSRKQRLILLLGFYEGLTQREIGATLSLSPSQVSRQQKRALLQIKHELYPLFGNNPKIVEFYRAPKHRLKQSGQSTRS